AQPCQGWGRGFESHHPLQFEKDALGRLFSFLAFVATRWCPATRKLRGRRKCSDGQAVVQP
ncbi:hypothetical protein, partial [Gluconobacter sp.]|uniref:hypothetical protein n=1 Tax=Gluconobacter sp. TaxID=1876758 RepID=UPI0039E8D9B9